jgi:hypothetical protein
MSQASVLIALLWALYPLWIAAGWYDHHWPRRPGPAADLQDASLHLLMLGEVAFALALALAFDPSPGLLAWLLTLAVAHLLTTVADTRRADRRRRAGALARHVHGFLDVLPLLALALYVVLHAPQLDGTAGAGWTLHARHPALPPAMWAAVVAPTLLLAIVPGTVAFGRAWRAHRTTARA